MGTIIAIGGGEIGRPGYPVETLSIDKVIISSTGKKHPKLLFIPTASSDSEGYYNIIKKHFGRKLGCKVDVLYLLKENSTAKEIKRKILSSDIIYVGGGNTLKMMNIWKRRKIDVLLRQAHKKGVVLAGLSAGAVCWFKYANSDSRKFKTGSAELIKVSCLGLVNLLVCPHYDAEKNRKKSLKKMMKTIKQVGVALDNCSAIEIKGKNYRILTSKKTANAYKVYWKKGKYHKEKIEHSKKFKSLKELLVK